MAFLGLARLVARLRVLREPGAWIGRRTLAVYVLHWPLVAALTWLGGRRPDLFTPWLRSQWAEVLYPIVVTALVVAACLLLHRLLHRVGLGVLFQPPAFLHRWVTRGARTSTGVTATSPAPVG